MNIPTPVGKLGLCELFQQKNFGEKPRFQELWNYSNQSLMVWVREKSCLKNYC